MECYREDMLTRHRDVKETGIFFYQLSAPYDSLYVTVSVSYPRNFDTKKLSCHSFYFFRPE